VRPSNFVSAALIDLLPDLRRRDLVRTAVQSEADVPAQPLQHVVRRRRPGGCGTTKLIAVRPFKCRTKRGGLLCNRQNDPFVRRPQGGPVDGPCSIGRLHEHVNRPPLAAEECVPIAQVIRDDAGHARHLRACRPRQACERDIFEPIAEPRAIDRHIEHVHRPMAAALQVTYNPREFVRCHHVQAQHPAIRRGRQRTAVRVRENRRAAWQGLSQITLHQQNALIPWNEVELCAGVPHHHDSGNERQ
jgi:hypothetical protein